ncbi:MAG: Flp pilus assembly complex ATPase component TadA [Phycisphaerales bacterium]|nr:Flp pilus assembly complex ATPase component TadA [Phycisphaerales bacterium]
MARRRKKLGEVLQAQGVLTAEQVEQAVQIARGAGKRLGEAVVDAGFAKEEQVAKALAAQFGLTYHDLSTDPGVELKLIPEDLVKKFQVLPLSQENGKLKVIVSDPLDLEFLDMLRFRLNTEVELSLASASRIRAFLDSKGAAAPKMVDEDSSLITDSIDRSIDRSMDKSIDVAVTGEEAPIIKLCNRMIIEAVRNRSSDIHVEPMADRVRLRYRIDGVCIERDNLPKRMQSAVLARLKLMAGMNIAERRVPQDGRIKMGVDDALIDFRVSACPAYHGESIVLRILRPESVRIGLENLGFESDNLENFNRIIRRPNGVFLVTGPTGSGKTTTLYSALDVLNRPDRKIITAEDPVEYSFTGMNQCQVREAIGLTFPAILRSMLRQAPNIILIGEIRDIEVADIAIQAALTGHLVFSTLHTNDAPSAMTRLIDMGVKPFLVASSVQAVMAQRLIRMLCKDCKAPQKEPDPKLLSLVGITKEERDAGNIQKAVGCTTCGGTGYRGRKAIFEMMIMTPPIRDLAFKRATVTEIRAAALAGGMRPLLGDGKIKILRGDTAPEEIARVAQAD